MTALAAERVGVEKEITAPKFAVKGNVKIWKGSLVMIDAGYVKPGVSASAATLFFKGIALETVDNTGGADGAKTCAVELPVKGRCRLWANDGVNTVVVADRGKLAYIEDDQTVGNLSTSKTACGRIHDVTSEGVFVDHGST